MAGSRTIAKRRDIADVLCFEVVDMAEKHGPNSTLTRDVIQSIRDELTWWEKQANDAVAKEKLDAFEDIFAATDKLNEAIKTAESMRVSVPTPGSNRSNRSGLQIGDATRKMIEFMEGRASPVALTPTSNRSSGLPVGDATRKMIEAMESKGALPQSSLSPFSNANPASPAGLSIGDETRKMIEALETQNHVLTQDNGPKRQKKSSQKSKVYTSSSSTIPEARSNRKSKKKRKTSKTKHSRRPSPSMDPFIVSQSSSQSLPSHGHSQHDRRRVSRHPTRSYSLTPKPVATMYTPASTIGGVTHDERRPPNFGLSPMSHSLHQSVANHHIMANTSMSLEAAQARIQAQAHGVEELITMDQSALVEVYIENLEGLPRQSLDGRLYISVTLAWNGPTEGPFSNPVPTRLACLDATLGKAIFNEVVSLYTPSKGNSPPGANLFLCFNLLCPMVIHPMPLVLASGYIPLFPPESHEAYSIVDHPTNTKLIWNQSNANNAFSPSGTLAETLPGGDEIVLAFTLPSRFYRPITNPDLLPMAAISMKSPNLMTSPGGFRSGFQSDPHGQFLINPRDPKSPSLASVSAIPRPITSQAHEAFRGIHPMGGVIAAPALPDGRSLPPGMDDTPTVRALVLLNESLSTDRSAFLQELEMKNSLIDDLKRQVTLKTNQLRGCQDQTRDIEASQRQLELKDADSERLISDLKLAHADLDSSRKAIHKLERELKSARMLGERHQSNLQDARLDLVKEKKKVVTVFNDLRNTEARFDDLKTQHRSFADENCDDVQDRIPATVPLNAQQMPQQTRPKAQQVRNPQWAPSITARRGDVVVSEYRTPEARNTTPSSRAMTLLKKLDNLDDLMIPTTDSSHPNACIPGVSTDSILRPSRGHNTRPHPTSTSNPLVAAMIPLAASYAHHILKGSYHDELSRVALDRRGLVVAENDIQVDLIEPIDSEAYHDFIHLSLPTGSSNISVELESETTSGTTFLVIKAIDNPSLYRIHNRTDLPENLDFELLVQSSELHPRIQPDLPVVTISCTNRDGHPNRYRVTLPILPLFFISGCPHNIASDDTTRLRAWNRFQPGQGSGESAIILNRLFEELLNLRKYLAPYGDTTLHDGPTVPVSSRLYKAGLLYCMTSVWSNDSPLTLEKICRMASSRGVGRSLAAFYTRSNDDCPRWRVIFVGCDSRVPLEKRVISNMLSNPNGSAVLVEIFQGDLPNSIGITLVAPTNEILTILNDSIFAALDLHIVTTSEESKDATVTDRTSPLRSIMAAVVPPTHENMNIYAAFDDR